MYLKILSHLQGALRMEAGYLGREERKQVCVVSRAQMSVVPDGPISALQTWPSEAASGDDRVFTKTLCTQYRLVQAFLDTVQQLFP